MRKTLTEIATGKSPLDLKKQNLEFELLQKQIKHINSERKWRWIIMIFVPIMDNFLDWLIEYIFK
jgi:hypothetical protein